MGKMTSIYLTDQEVADLERFCEENKCTKYSVLKTALRQLVSKHENSIEQERSENGEEPEEETAAEETPSFGERLLAALETEE